MQLRCKRKIYKEIYRMFVGDFQMLRNKRHFVISVMAINVFYCTCNGYYSGRFHTQKKFFTYNILKSEKLINTSLPQ